MTLRTNGMALFAALSLVAPAAAQDIENSKAQRFRVVEVARGLNNPFAVAALPNGDMLITEKPGTLRIVRGGKLEPKPIAGTPEVVYGGQGGLLEVIAHPNFASNSLIYLSYSGRGAGGVGTEVARARLDGDTLRDLTVIYQVAPKTAGGAHYGGKLLFGPDGMLYLTTGDRFTLREQAQELNSGLGKVIRMTEDGKTPPDNPFAQREGAQPQIFSYGHRNVQGLALRPGTGAIWQHEHGARGGDEVNILRAGTNYGWPRVSYGVNYDGSKVSDAQSLPGLAEPVVYWVPSIAPSGMAFYDGDKLAGWKGDLFVGALAGSHLRRLKLAGDRVVEQETLLAGVGERIRDVRTADGLLYVLTDGNDARLLRLEPAG